MSMWNVINIINIGLFSSVKIGLEKSHTNYQDVQGLPQFRNIRRGGHHNICNYTGYIQQTSVKVAYLPMVYPSTPKR